MRSRSLSPPPSSPTTTTTTTPLPLRILTHNIRYATTAPFPGELPWPTRAPRFLAQLRYHTRHCASSLICLQEVLHGQLRDILDGLNSQGPPPPCSPSPSPAGASESEWTSLGVGRDDGATAGEYAPILFRPAVWCVARWFTMWLSPTTPWVPGSKGWDAASVRIVTVAVLVHRGSGRRVVVANTHLDDQGPVSRVEGARLIVRVLREVMAVGKGEVEVDGGFVAGDLNSEVGGGAYRVLNERGSGWVDSRTLAEEGSGSGSGCYGEEMTFTGFDGLGDGEGRKTKIDFIHLSTTDTDTEAETAHDEHGTAEIRPAGSGSASGTQWAVQGYAVLPNRFEDGVYLSDHRAVVGDVLLMPRPLSAEPS